MPRKMDQLNKDKAAKMEKGASADDPSDRKARLVVFIKTQMRELKAWWKNIHLKKNIDKRGSRYESPRNGRNLKADNVMQTVATEGAKSPAQITQDAPTDQTYKDDLLKKTGVARNLADDYGILQLAYHKPEDYPGMFIIRILKRRVYYPPYTGGCYMAYDPYENFRYLYDNWLK